MKPLRRQDTAPRVEMTPLLDVVFLLLTFFIFTWVMMVRAQVLPVEMVAVEAGGQPGQSDLQVLLIDRQGQFFFNREPVTADELDGMLEQFAQDPAQPTLFIAAEAVQGRGELDRLPLLVQVLQRVQAAGVKNMAVVGPPEASGPR